MINQTYYWLCGYPLQRGSVVLPGNWGRIINLERLNLNICAEFVFEKVRLEKFSDKPSRLESLFLCPTIKELKDFRHSTQRAFDLLYEVELIDARPVLFSADWTKFPIFKQQQNYTVSYVEQLAEAYWQGDGENKTEILTNSRARIVKLIED